MQVIITASPPPTHPPTHPTILQSFRAWCGLLPLDRCLALQGARCSWQEGRSTVVAGQDVSAAGAARVPLLHLAPLGDSCSG